MADVTIVFNLHRLGNVSGLSVNGNFNVVSGDGGIQFHLVGCPVGTEVLHVLSLNGQTGHRGIIDELDVVDQHFIVGAALPGIGIGRDGNQHGLRINGILGVDKRNSDANPLAAGGGYHIVLGSGHDIGVVLVFRILIAGAISDDGTERGVGVCGIGLALLELHPHGDGVRTRIQGNVIGIALAVDIGHRHVEISMVHQVGGVHRTCIHAAGGHGAVSHDAEDGRGINAGTGLAGVGIGRLREVVTCQRG